jgi:hypothetical protein
MVRFVHRNSRPHCSRNSPRTDRDLRPTPRRDRRPSSHLRTRSDLRANRALQSVLLTSVAERWPPEPRAKWPPPPACPPPPPPWPPPPRANAAVGTTARMPARTRPASETLINLINNSFQRYSTIHMPDGHWLEERLSICLKERETYCPVGQKRDHAAGSI